MSVLSSLNIPAAKLAAIEIALSEAFNTIDVTSINTLVDGLSGSSVYKIVVNGKSYLLKLSLLNDTKNAFSDNAVLAAKAGIAPQLHYENKLQGISISDFVNSKPIRSVFTPDRLINQLAGVVKAIHKIPSHTGGKDLFETVDALIERFKKSNILSGTIFNECFKYYEKIKHAYPRQDEDKVLSHNDLNPNNILCDGEKVWIIDWDEAYLNDRYVDLANLANFFIHSEEQEIEFLNVYFDYMVDDHKMARFYLIRQVCRIVYAMLMFQLAMQNKPAGYLHSQEMQGIDLKTFGALMTEGKLSLTNYEGQLFYGKALLNEAVHQMRTSRFKNSVTQLS